MKLNIANPLTGAQAMVEIEDDRKLAVLWDRRIAQEVPGDELGDEFKGYIFKITGGCDKQGFPMKQGVLVPHRVRLLLGKQPGFWRPNRDGAHRRRSVRGCIVAQDIASLNLVLVKQGETPLPALERVLPRRLGPKRASKIRKLFNLSKQDDVRKYVIRREIPLSEKDKEKGKRKQPRTKAPRIQRLVTARTLQHKRHILALKKRWSAKSKADAAEYAALLAARKAEKAKKSQKVSERKSEKKTAAAAAPAKATKAAAKPAAKPAAKAAPVATPAATTTTTSKGAAGKKKAASGKK